MKNRSSEEREKALENLVARLTDWSVLRSAVKELGEGALRRRIRKAVDAEILEDDRFRVWLDHEDPLECLRILAALAKRIVSEGIEMEEPERLVFLRAQIEEVSEKVEEAERRLNDFIREHERLLSEERIAGVRAADMIEMEGCKIEMAGAKARKRAVKKKLKETPEYIVTSTVVQYGPEVMNIKRFIAAKKEKLDEARSKYGEGRRTAKMEKEINDLKLKLMVLENRSQKRETRELNPLYRDLEDELIEIEEQIERLEDDIKEATERAEKSRRALKESARLRREKRKLDRVYDEAAGLFEALQEKIDEEFERGRLEGGELEVTLLAGPSRPRPVQSRTPEERTGGQNGERN